MNAGNFPGCPFVQQLQKTRKMKIVYNISERREE